MYEFNIFSYYRLSYIEGNYERDNKMNYKDAYYCLFNQLEGASGTAEKSFEFTLNSSAPRRTEKQSSSAQE